MTASWEPSHPRNGGGGGRRGRRSGQSKRQQKSVGNGIQEWCTDRSLPPRSWTEPLVVEMYLFERAADTWRPANSNLKTAPKLNTLAAIPPAVFARGVDLELDVSGLDAHPCITNMISNFRRRLPFDQRAAVRSQPLTDEHLDVFLSHLDWLEEGNFVHTAWTCRWRVMVLVTRAAALRPSEVVRMQFAWLEFRDGWLILTIPATKSSDAPTIKVISAASPSGIEAMAALQAWMRLLDGLGYILSGSARVFPRVEADPSTKDTYRSVSNKTLADFPDVAAEYHGDLDPAEIPAGSNTSCEWRCTRCDGKWTTRPLNRTSASSGCPHCARTRRRAASATAPKGGTAVALVDPIETRVQNPRFRPAETGWTRTESAIIQASDQLADDYKKLAEAAGLSPRSKFEGISAYGPRRGATVALANDDADRGTMRTQLGHTRIESARPYIDERDITLPPALAELDGWSFQ